MQIKKIRPQNFCVLVPESIWLETPLCLLRENSMVHSRYLILAGYLSATFFTSFSAKAKGQGKTDTTPTPAPTPCVNKRTTKPSSLNKRQPIELDLFIQLPSRTVRQRTGSSAAASQDPALQIF